MLRIILAAVLAGIALGVTVASLVGKLTTEGILIGLTSITIIVVLLTIVYNLNKNDSFIMRYFFKENMH